MQVDIEVTTTPPDLQQRLARYPAQTRKVMKKTMEASLLHVQENIPGYPEAPAGVDASRRTGTLGRKLGVSQAGGVAGKAEIHLIEQIGTHSYQGTIGTLLPYADRVIGNQGQPWKRYWWTLKGVAKKAADGIVRLHNVAAEELARFIDGLG